MMTKQELKNSIKVEISDRLIQTVFDRLVFSHIDAMERSIGETFLLDGHRWSIHRNQSIWEIRCEGMDDWKVWFDTGRRGITLTDDGYEYIDTMRIERNFLMDTVGHLKSAMDFVSEFISTTNPDGSIYKEHIDAQQG